MMLEFKAIVGRQLNNRWVVYDIESSTTSIEFAETIRDWDTNVFLTNAYWDTAEQKLKGVCIDLDALPVVNAGKVPDYYVYLGTREGVLYYARPYGACVIFQDSIKYYAQSFAEFFNENTVYGGVGDDDCYDFVWKSLYRDTVYRVPIGMEMWNDLGGSYNNCLENIHSGEYVKLPFGLTEFHFEDACLYRNVFGSLYLPKSIRYLNMDGLMDMADYCCEKVVIPSSVSFAAVRTCKNRDYDFHIECNPNSYLWQELMASGYERIIVPNYKI